MHLVINYLIVAAFFSAFFQCFFQLLFSFFLLFGLFFVCLVEPARFYNVDPGSTDLATGHVLGPWCVARSWANLKFLLYFIVVSSLARFSSSPFPSLPLSPTDRVLKFKCGLPHALHGVFLPFLWRYLNLSEGSRVRCAAQIYRLYSLLLLSVRSFGITFTFVCLHIKATNIINYVWKIWRGD